MVALVPLGPRRAIISETRSVSFLPADRSRRSLLEVQADHHPSPPPEQECCADAVALS